LHGGVCDSFVASGRTDLIGRVLEFVRRNGLLAGVAGHDIAVPMSCEKAGLDPDFYLKTHNAKNYWSASPMPRHDSVWEKTPEQTRAFMATVRKPWIAYKVLGAGAIHPREGFAYAFESGADFICVGMFEFQVEEDVALAREAVVEQTPGNAHGAVDRRRAGAGRTCPVQSRHSSSTEQKVSSGF